MWDFMDNCSYQSNHTKLKQRQCTIKGGSDKIYVYVCEHTDKYHTVAETWKAPTTVVPWAELSKKLATRLSVPSACACGIRPVIFSITKKIKNARIANRPLWIFSL